MRTKKFLTVFLLLFVAVFALGVKADAMPKAFYYLTTLSPTLYGSKEVLVDEVTLWYKNRVGALEEVEQEVAAIKNREIYTQEQAKKEIASLIVEKKLPDYIFDKGEYKYDSKIVGCYPIEVCNLLSQPDPKADAKAEISANDPYEGSFIADRAVDYFGEWTSTQGEKWIIIGYKFYTYDTVPDPDYEDSVIEIMDQHYEVGFLRDNQVGLTTDEQAREIATAIEYLKIATELAESEMKATVLEYDKKLEQMKAQLQQAQQAQQRTQQSQSFTDWLGEYHTWYCNRCGKQVSGYNLPTSNNCLPKGAKRAGPHNWVKVK